MAETFVEVERLFGAVQTKANANRISLRQAALEIGVSPSLLSRLRSGLRPDLDAYAAIVRWLGASADEFLSAELPASASATEQRELEAEIGALLRARKDLREDEKNYLHEIFTASVRLVESRRPGQDAQ